MRVNNDALVTNQVLNANFNSQAQQLNQVFGYAIQGVITGTPTGSFILQGSADANSGNIFPTNWTDITSSSPVSAAGTFMFNIPDVEYNWVRLSYTDTSGGTSTAILNATINTKGI